METGPAGAGWLLSGFGASLSLILLLLAPRPEYDQGAPRYDFSLHNATYRPGLAMDIYVPTLLASSDRAGELRPVLFFVYGGGWKRGKRRNWFGLHQCVGESFAASGMITVLPDYTKSAGPSVVGALIIRPAVAAIATAGLWGGVRHAIGRDPARPFSRVWGAIYLALLAWDTVPFVVQLAVQQAPVNHPAHVEDVASALTWVQNNIADYGGDPSRIVVMGHSAGAHLVSMLLVQPAFLETAGYRKGATDIRGAVLVSGPFSGQLMEESFFARVTYLYWAFGYNRTRWQPSFPAHHTQLQLAGNLGKVLPKSELPPLLLVNAEWDWGLLEHTAEWETALKATGADVRSEVIGGTNHLSVISGLNRRLSQAEETLKPLVLDFCQVVLKDVPPGGTEHRRRNPQ